MRSSRAWLQLLLACLVGGAALSPFWIGCYGPDCEQACIKALFTCGLTEINPGVDLDVQLEACTGTCEHDMNRLEGEAKAVGWIGCVEGATCETANDAKRLCLDCPAGYYTGITTGNSCQSGTEGF